MNNKDPKISIIIPTYNSGFLLEKCLSSISESNFNDYEIIIVKDDSNNSCKEIKEIKTIKLKGRKGPGYARNTGAKNSKGKVLLFLDSDVTIKRETLKKIWDSFKDNKKKIIQGVYSKKLTEKNIFSRYKNLYSSYKFNKADNSSLSSISSFCFAMLKNDFFSLGGFNKNYTFMKGAEDVDFGVRAYNKGYIIDLRKDIQVIHNKTYSFFSFLVSENRKIKSIMKIYLRNIFKKNRMKLSELPVSKNKITKMLHIVFSVLFAPIIIISIFMGIFIPKLLFFSLLMFLIFLFLNMSFISAIRKEKNIICLVLIHFLEMMITFISAVIGSVEYVLGEKY